VSPSTTARSVATWIEEHARIVKVIRLTPRTRVVAIAWMREPPQV